MFGLGTPELVVIGVIVFLIFGAKRLPDIGKGLGGAIREFRQVKKDLGGRDEKSSEKETKQTPSFEHQLVEEAREQVPAVKTAMDLKEKVEKVKEIVGS